MYAQLGEIRFDGTKSFVSFSTEEEAVIVEHALINRPAKLQGTAIGLQNITISLFLHQEFCVVKQEIEQLRAAKNSFKIMPLQWGNGDVEGDFVIKRIGRTNASMDPVGNTISASVELTLIQCMDRNRLEYLQQQAQNDAFAVGDKKPPTKSTRVNPTPCSKGVSDAIKIIKANAAAMDEAVKSYTNLTATNYRIKSHLNSITGNCDRIIAVADTPGSCVNTNSGALNIKTSCQNVKAKAAVMLADIAANDQMPNSIFAPNIGSLKAHNTEFQAAVQMLVTAAGPITKSSILNK